ANPLKNRVEREALFQPADHVETRGTDHVGVTCARIEGEPAVIRHQFLQALGARGPLRVAINVIGHRLVLEKVEHEQFSLVSRIVAAGLSLRGERYAFGFCATGRRMPRGYTNGRPLSVAPKERPMIAQGAAERSPGFHASFLHFSPNGAR